MHIPFRTVAILCIALAVGIAAGWTIHALVTRHDPENLGYSLRDATTSYT